MCIRRDPEDLTATVKIRAGFYDPGDVTAVGVPLKHFREILYLNVTFELCMINYVGQLL